MCERLEAFTLLPHVRLYDLGVGENDRNGLTAHTGPTLEMPAPDVLNNR
jgi:hypothetical protein